MKKPSKRTLERQKDKLWRQAVLKRDNYRCQVCPKAKKNKVLQVHHILPKQFKEFRYDTLNGVVLCFHHHKVGKQSAHLSAIWFAEWLKANKPEQYNYIKMILKELIK